MSTPDATAEAAPVTDAPAPKKRGAKRLLLLIPVVLLVAGGGGYYAWSQGLIGSALASKPAPPPGSKLNIDPQSDPAHPRYTTSYLKIEGAFTTNLQGSPHFVQVEIGVATIRDPINLTHVTTHEIAVRSAVLAVLAQENETEIATIPGRAALQTKLRAAINRVLADKEGFGGISDVYLTGLVIQ